MMASRLGPDQGQGFYQQINVAGAADVDAAAVRIKAAGGTLLSEPADQPWGARMFQFKDPDGFKLGVSTPLADNTRSSTIPLSQPASPRDLGTRALRSVLWPVTSAVRLATIALPRP